MVMKVEVLAEVLSRVAAELQEEHEAAAQQGRWRDALEKLFTSLIWRTIALALRLGIASPQFDPRTDPVVLARRLRVDCANALGTLKPTDDKADPFRKVKAIADVLDGTLDVVGVYEAWTGVDRQEPFFLAMTATRLGQAEIGLGFAEEGFWEQVAAWQSQKGGRGQGWTNEWRKRAAPIIQEWIDGDPAMKGKVLVNKLWEWLAEYRRGHPTEKLPDYDSLRKAIDAMHKQGMIRQHGK